MKKIFTIIASLLFIINTQAQWTSFPGTATAISCGASTELGCVFSGIVGTGYTSSAYKYNFTSNAWTLMSTAPTGDAFTSIGVGNDGAMWLRSNGFFTATCNLLKFGLPAVAGVTSEINGVLDNISVLNNSSAIGTVGSVNNNIYRTTSTTNAFSSFPGSTTFSGKKVILAGSGDAMALSQAASGNNIFRFIAGAWVAVPSTTVINATDIAVGQNTNQMIALSGGNLYYYNTTTGTWVQDATAPANITKITMATDASGKIYVLTNATTNNIYTTTYAAISCLTPAPTSTTVASALTVCAGNTTTLTASGTGTLKWYASTVATTVLGTGASFTTPSVSQNTTFYVANVVGTCESARTPITVNIVAASNPGIISGPQTFCATQVPYYSSTVSGGTWSTSNPTLLYINPTTGDAQGTGVGPGSVNVKYTMPSVAGCPSPFAILPVTITSAPPNPINATPAANLSICSGNTTILSVATPSQGTPFWSYLNPAPVYLYAAATITSPALTSTTTFRVWNIDISNNCYSPDSLEMTVVVKPIPATPTITSSQNITICQGTTTTITATGSGTLQWFAGSTGGTALGTGTSFTTPAINSYSEFYVQATVNGCTSARVGVGINVNGLPAAPISTTSAANLNRCSVGTTTLSANNVSLTTLRWYASPTSDTILATGTTFTTPILSTTTTFYVARFGQCESARTAITVNVGVTPTDITPAANLYKCSGNTTTLTVSGNSISWFTTATGGTSIDTGNVFTTPVLNYSITYYAQGGGCLTRTGIQVIVNATPAPPTNTTSVANSTICSGTSPTLSLNASNLQTNWYDSIVGGNFLFQSAGGFSSIQVPITLTNTTTFYVSSIIYNTGCQSTRTPFLVTVIGSNPGTLSGTQSVCANSTTQFSSTVSGGTWSSSNNAIATVSTSGLVTGNAIGTATITYTVAGTTACPTAVTATRTVTVTTGTTAGTLSGVQTICLPGTTSFSSTESGGTWTSSSNAIATVNATTGVVTGVAAGTATITYTVQGGSGCTAASVTRTVQVYSAVSAGTLSGTQTVCTGSSRTFTSTVSGGTWSSSNNSIATVNASGVVSGLTAGTATITYTIAGIGACPSASVTRTVTVTAAPIAGTLSGTQAICLPGTTTFTSTTIGGTWSSLNTSIATVNATTGVVTGVAAGTATIRYIVTGTAPCTNDTATRTVQVFSTITAGTLSGTQAICAGSTTTFSSTVSGGTWSSSNNNIATVNANGLVTAGSTAGTATITYTVAGVGTCTGASATRTLTVKQATASTRSQTICQGSSYSFKGQTLRTAGTYRDTITNVAGCDSVITLTLSVTPAIQRQMNQTICKGSSYIFKGQTLTQAGTYRDTAQTVQGCDSITILTLIVTPAIQRQMSQTICQGSSYTFKGQNLTTAGTYRDTTSTTAGCDSITILSLVVTPAIQRQLGESICFGASYSFKGQTLTTAGTYRDTTSTAQGCDSITILTLNVRSKATNIINAQVCTGQSYSFKGQSLTQSGQYFDTLQTTAGCDSFITLNLSINSFVTGTTTKAICQGESFTFNGQSLTQAGQYLDTLTSVGGCDSILTLTLTVNVLPTPTITKTGASLATQVFTSYQWKLNGSNISNAMSQNYTATANGSYTVEVIDANGCKNTSAAVQVTGLSIENTRNDLNVSIYPNPANEVLNIEVEAKEFMLTITDIAGRRMMIAENKKAISLSALASGVYNIEIKTTNGIARKQFIKK